jgi:outer membrane lipase/esterase
MKRNPAGIFVLFAILVTAVSANASGDRPFKRFVVFGDSLSDPGNAFVVLRRVETPPFELIPDAPYARGGLHFTNGETWVEQLAKDLHVRVSAGPALLAPRVFSNYAVGGARARAEGSFDLTTQVNRYFGDSRGTASDEALHIIWVGGNDVRDALEALAIDASGVTSMGILAGALATIQDQIITLTSAGARTFLVANAPNLALTPAVRLQGPLVQAAAQQLTVAFNQGLDAILAGLQPSLPATFFRLDIFGLLNQIVANPAAVGLSEVEDSCITPAVVVNAFCAHPNQFLFWDGIHPTRAGHAIIADQALSVLTQ